MANIHRTSDEDAVRIALDAAEASGCEISDVTARTIASWFYGGMCDGYRFVSTGTIRPGLWRELTDNGRVYSLGTPFELRCLDFLGTYLLAAGERGPVEGWADKWVRS
jgi:hypothetical protein